MGFFEAAGNAAASVVGFVGDTMQNGGAVIADTVEDLVDGAADGAGKIADAVDHALEGNPITPIIGGVIVGFLDMIRDVVGGAMDLVRDIFDIVGLILKFDLMGAFMGVISLVGHVVQLVFIVLRSVTFGYIVGGVVKQFHKSALRTFVNNLIGSTFNAATAAKVREKVGLTGSNPFGFPLNANDVVMRIDSATFPNLAQHDKDLKLDLYTLSGRSNDWGRQWEFWPRARTEGYVVNDDGSESPISRFAIADFLDSDGKRGRLRFYAMTRQAQQQHKRMATRLHEQLGVRLIWKGGDDFSWFRSADRDSVDITSYDDEYLFSASAPTSNNGSTWLVAKGLKQGGGVDVCDLVTVCTFRLADGFGVTVGQGGTDSDRPAKPGCVTPDRDDQCCPTVLQDPKFGTGIYHRDVWPPELFQYVLSHEIGHYMGLCHYGHDSFAYNMWSMAYMSSRAKIDNQQAFIDWSVFHYYLAHEPIFTLNDAKNCWRFIFDQMRPCVTA